jgi:Mlc titration factor MtfA (ptsG expression regulator)
MGFGEYAFTNQYEFMAVLTEYFFESNLELKVYFKAASTYGVPTLFKEEWMS